MISAACLIVLYFLRLCRNEVFSSTFVAEGVRCTFSCWCSLPLGSMLCVICFGRLSFLQLSVMSLMNVSGFSLFCSSFRRMSIKNFCLSDNVIF